ncbi:HD domain-containing protein [Lutibacter holmesii]|uniref:HD domain-containing protein n=1 Tax=Lutibacter holmesii TaxID=1137985 RepID=A0ABW3WIZ6_9FLAO
MIQDKYQKAIEFAGEKHKNQKMPGTNSNYLLHISNVAMEVLIAYNEKQDFDIYLAIQLAILHDTIEDTDTELDELKKKFGEKVAIGVSALTKNENLPSKLEQMKDSLKRINKLTKEVAIVKLADRITNLQEPPYYWTNEKKTSYCKEAEIINQTLENKNNYLNQRLQTKIIDYRKYLK